MVDNTGGLIGRPAVRIDGRAKVTGQARYASDETVPHPAYAWLVTSTIAKGRIRAIDLAAAKAVPGVLDILTHETGGGAFKPLPGPDGGPTTTTLDGDRVWHAGQIVAVVVAETWEAAREAGRKVVVSYAAETPSATIDSPGVLTEPKKAAPGREDPKVGDAAKALAAAPVKVDLQFTTPAQHHNALELFTTTAVWDGPKLTIYEPSQAMWLTKTSIATQLGLDPANVRVISRFVGGAFGGKGLLSARTACVALAAKRLNRPVKLVPTRADGFTIATYRAETRHHLQLGATRDGKLTALRHEGWELTSRPSDYNVSGVESTARMYACPNIATAVNLVHAERATPGFMRAPAEVPYMFALESGMDELAYALDMDPIELRRINDTQTDPVTKLPYSSRSLMACYDQAAAKFGWGHRNPKPGSMRSGDWLIGWGCATACYPSNIAPAAARLSLTPNGKAQIGLAGHELGTGAYTVVAIVVAEHLGLGVDDVTVLMGDSNLPPVTVAGGSNNAASTSHVAAKACEEIRGKLAAAAVQDQDSVFARADPAKLKLAKRELVGPDGKAEPLAKALGRVAAGALEVLAENTPQGMPPNAMKDLHDGKVSMLFGGARKDAIAYAFGAHLVEVRIHRLTREIRTPRVVSAFASGTIVNPLTAYSQYMGGVIWGLSSALHEASEIDRRAARYVNTSLADYLIPVEADIGEVDVIMVPEADDRVNPMGIKGIGEIGIVGVNAAVANAVFHATGERIRDLPLRIEQLL